MMQRVFLGFQLPEEVSRQLLQARCELPGARWQSVAQLHITLRFLGQLDPPQLVQLGGLLNELSSTAIRLRISGGGCFGTASKPVALWAGLSPEEPLQALRREVDRLLEPLALAPDRYLQYRPHITLARLTSGSPGLTGALERVDTLASQLFSLGELCLFSSTLTAGGSHYSVERRFPLRG